MIEEQEPRATQNRSGMNQTLNEFHPLSVNREDKRQGGVISSDGLINIQEQLAPPKTANDGKRKRKRKE